MSVAVKIKGERELLRKLTIIPEQMRQRIRETMAQEADEIVAMMRRLAPPHIAPTIGWRWGGRAPNGSVGLGQVRAPVNGSTLTLTIYAAHFTSAWFEFGTADRFQKTKGYKFVGRIGRHPFFFPSYRAKRKAAKRAIRAAVRQAAREVAAR